MAAGIPIRLVQENHNTIELDATSMTLSTSRKVGGSALPLTGSRRIGMDLNVNKAMINIQGIIADDREGTLATAHTASINFGRKIEGQQFTMASNLEALLNQELRLQTLSTATSNQEKTITFTNTASAGATAYSSNGGAGSTPTVLVNTSDATSVQLATAVVNYINNQLSSDFTATLVEGTNYESKSINCVVNIVMVAKGSVTAMRRTTPKFKQIENPVNAVIFEPPRVSPRFGGGTDSVKKSAGDKAMDLYGIINNSTRRTFRSANPIDLYGTRRLPDHVKDYIIGIQIPYNSSIKATGGEQYVARNFFMPTGFYYGKEKTSEGNDHPASVTFDPSEETTGIQGSVQKFDITYDAGESVYNFNMIFAPIDNLIIG
ncbi:MAG: hypothetical protein CXT67_00565 [Methanobacteriota archaeon]|nr:MAG: hypothetical protein CXT67_00565 [Euryarchaeota archaeon]